MNQFLEAASIALSAIWEYKLRSFMTVLGNIVAVTSIIAVVTLVQGMNVYVTHAILSDVGADDFTIQRFPVIRTQQDEDRTRNNPLIKLAEATDVRRFSENVAAVAATASAGASAVYGTQEVDGVQVQGVSRDYIFFDTFNAER
ncbi:MAG: ABC transporter permease, partial [Vicinamibacterales bacterium]